MLGSSILVTPVLDQGATSVTGYFPKSIWYSLTDSSVIDSSAGGKSISLATPLTAINVHAKGGSIIPMQSSAMTTTEARKTPFSLAVFACSMGGAEGQLFWDDGEQVSLSSYLHVTFNADNILYASGHLSSEPVTTGDPSFLVPPPRLETIVIYGLDLTKPSSLLINGKPLGHSQITFDNMNTITFSGLEIDITHPFSLNWF